MNLTNTRLAQSSRPDFGTTRPPYSSHTLPGQQAPLFDRTVAMMNEISSAGLFCRDIHALGQVILDIAVDYIGAHRGSVMLVDETGRLRIIASKGLHLHLRGDLHAKRGEGVAGKLINDCMPVIVKDIEKDERFRKANGPSYRTPSFISHPIMSNHSLRGIINLSDKRDAVSFDDDDLTLLGVAARQSSVAMEATRAMNDMQRRTREFEEMNERMMQSDLAKAEFLVRASHDLRTPLNSLKGAAYCIKTSSRLSKTEQDEFINIIANEAEKLSEAVERLLLPFGAEGLMNSVDRVPIDLSSLLADLLSMPRLREKVANRDVSISMESGGLSSHVTGDRMRVVNFLYNLLDGLCGTTESGSAIALSVQENDHVRIDLSLSTRLPRGAVDCLLNPAPVMETAGLHDYLALSLARRLAEKHQWNIRVADSVSGTCVTVLIPKHSKSRKDAFIGMAMGLFLDLTSEILCANRSSIMAVERTSQELRIVRSRGFHGNALQSAAVRLGEGISGSVASRGMPLFVPDIEADPSFGRPNLPRYTTPSFMSFPVLVRGLPFAVINMANRQDGKAFTLTDMRIASALCERVSHCFEDLCSSGDGEHDFSQLMSCLERLVSAATRYHKKGSRIPELMERLLEEISCGEKERDQAVYASAVYDLGLTLLGDAAFKEPSLSPAARRAVTAHPLSTLCVLRRFEFSDDVREGVLHHHERFDGSGYPDGLQGEAIPLLSRALAVVDSFTAMLCDRPDRRALSKAEALAAMREGAGTLYDPVMVKALERAAEALV